MNELTVEIIENQNKVKFIIVNLNLKKNSFQSFVISINNKVI